MNDDELITAVRESVTGVHMNLPAERIVRRSRAIRARRRISGLAGALAVVAGVALAVPALLPAGHPAGARLTAWTVARHSDGSIYVTLRELRDPAGLQSKLRAEGLPVNVSFSGPPLSPHCRAYPASRHLLSSVGRFRPGNGEDFLVFHPSALPSGAGVSIADFVHDGFAAAPGATGRHGGQPPAGFGRLSVGLVYASPQCTG